MPTVRVGEKVPEALNCAVVLGRDGAPCELGSLWKDGPCLLDFVRHFGCTACSEHVFDLVPRLAELRAWGVRVALIGNGDVRFVDGFVERHGLARHPVEIFTDPTLAAFSAAGLARGFWKTLGPRALVDKARTLARGIPGHGVEGDAFQQGGAFLVDRGGAVLFAHANARLGDHVSIPDLVDVAMRLFLRNQPILA